MTALERAEQDFTTALAGAQEAAIDFLAASRADPDAGYLDVYVGAIVSAQRLVEALGQFSARTTQLERFAEYPALGI